MGTNYIAPIWRMPRNANKDKLSNYSIKFGTSEVINFDSYTLPDKYTISIWLNPDASYGTDYGYYIGGSPTAGNGFAIAQGGAAFSIGELYFYFGGGASTGTGVVLNQNEWSHVLLVVDKTFGSQGKIETYLNNNLESTTTSFSSTPVSSFTSISIIGANKSDASQWNFSGEISQCCVFDYALSTDQINYLYNLNNPMAITGGEPIAYYPLGDNSNPTANAGYPNISVGADSVFDFNGSQAIDVPAVDLGVNGSISIWFNPETGGVADFVLVGEGSQGFDYVIRRSSGVFIIWIGSTFYQFAGFGSNVVTGGWNFLALIKSAGNVNLYLKNSNGEFSVSRTESNWASASLKFDRIGARTITPINLGFQGEISNFQAWDSVLLPTEITTLYNNGQPLMTGTQPQATNLKAWYKLNQHDSYWNLGGNGKWTFNNAAIN